MLPHLKIEEATWGNKGSMHSSEESLTAEVIGEDIQVDLVLS